MTPELIAAIKSFQKQNAMPVTGILLNSEFRTLLDQVAQVQFASIKIVPLNDGDSRTGKPSVIETRDGVEVEGTWINPDDKLDFPFNTSKITCTKRLRTCHEAYAHLPQPPSHSFSPNDGPIYGSERKTGSTYLYLSVDTSPTLAEFFTRRALVTFLTCWTNRADQKPRLIVSLVDLVSAGLPSARQSAWSPMAR